MARKFDELPPEAVVEKTIVALNANGFVATVVESLEAAKKAVLDRIPKGAEVFTLTSATVDAAGISEILNESGDYDAVRPKMAAAYGDASKADEMRKLGAAPNFAVASAHAVTEGGSILIASATGSQMPASAYGAGKMIFVISTMKIVKDLDEAHRRVQEHVIPLEDERALAAYGVHTTWAKTLILQKEMNPGRIEVILVKEKAGF